MVPPGAPLDDDVDIPFLARQFELTGADIRNVVLDAAYHAAQLDKSITLLQVLRAVARQFTKAGKVPTAVDFREHYGLLELDRSVAG
jgi:ATP-dependent 26S proteasome regulatory subunit